MSPSTTHPRVSSRRRVSRRRRGQDWHASRAEARTASPEKTREHARDLPMLSTTSPLPSCRGAPGGCVVKALPARPTHQHSPSPPSRARCSFVRRSHRAQLIAGRKPEPGPLPIPALPFRQRTSPRLPRTAPDPVAVADGAELPAFPTGETLGGFPVGGFKHRRTR